MKRRTRYALLLIAMIVPLSYNACQLTDESHTTRPKNSFPASLGTNTGNPKPTVGCQQILDATCNILIRAHASLNVETCRKGVLSTSLINNLGVPAQVLNPYYNLCEAEEALAIRSDEFSLTSCLNAIGQLDPQSTLVKSAYNPAAFNPFAGVMDMIPSQPNQCGRVFSNNTFTLPPVVLPPPRTRVVDFDNPAPSALPYGNQLAGVFQGIEFTAPIWSWSLPFAANSTSFVVNYGSTTGDTGFSFSGGPKTLISVKAFASVADVSLTIYDDQGQSITQTIPFDQKVHLIKTNFAKPSHRIYFHRVTSAPDPYRSAGVGLDDITYQLPEIEPSLAYVQSQYALWDRSQTQISSVFSSANTASNLIIALVHWDSGQLLSVLDSAGNIYQPAAPLVTTPNGRKQQIWFAQNIKSATQNKVTAVFANSQHLNQLSIYEYSGVDPSSPIDITDTMVISNQQQILVKTSVTKFSSELLFVGAIVDSDYPLFSYDYSDRSFFGLTYSTDRIVNQTGSYSISARLPVQTGWALQVIGLKGKSSF